MHLSYFIARRYLFAKKSHNVINIICIAVGSCALIIVLSIYNGFEEVVRSMYDRAMPDIAVTSASSKYFRTDTPAFDAVRSMPSVALYSESIEETVFLTYDREEGTAVLKGVEQAYTEDPELQSCIVDGEFTLMHGEVAQAVTGRGLAVEMGIRPRFLDPIEVYFPARDREISLVNPAASLNKETFYPIGMFFSGGESYANTLFVPIERARRLVGVPDNEAGVVELRLVPGADVQEGQVYAERDRLPYDAYREGCHLHDTALYHHSGLMQCLRLPDHAHHREAGRYRHASVSGCQARAYPPYLL